MTSAYGGEFDLGPPLRTPDETAPRQGDGPLPGVAPSLDPLPMRSRHRGHPQLLPPLADDPVPVAPPVTSVDAVPGPPTEALAATSTAVMESPVTGRVAAPRAGEGPVAGGEGHPDLTAVLDEVVDLGASDLHLTAGAPPTVRVAGELRPLEGYRELSGPEIQTALWAVLTQKQRETFERNLELDCSYALPGRARFRVNVYRQRGSVGAALRLIPSEIKPLDQLGIPQVIGGFANLPRGLVLVTGPTGSGKSTTLASLVDLANRTRRGHIVTVEDPIEFLHEHKSCVVNQREVGEDTKSFPTALRHVLRQDPDIILIGEMRDLETISVALSAAETGHLVFGTLHTQDAGQTVDRVIDVFPAEQQQQIRVQLAGALQGVVCQTLCKRTDGPGRVVATEVLVATPAIRNLIREGKTHQIYSAMQAGQQNGMHTLDQHLAELVRRGQIAWEHGFEKCHNVEDYRRLTGRA